MARELLKLIECEVDDWQSNTGRSRFTYEVYAGDFVKVYGDSANAYWHDFITYNADDRLNNYAISDRATILVLSDGGLVGYWKTLTLFYEFLEVYRRATDFFEIVA